jgi:hypothetical protein
MTAIGSSHMQSQGVTYWLHESSPINHLSGFKQRRVYIAYTTAVGARPIIDVTCIVWSKDENPPSDYFCVARPVSHMLSPHKVWGVDTKPMCCVASLQLWAGEEEERASDSMAGICGWLYGEEGLSRRRECACSVTLTSDSTVARSCCCASSAPRTRACAPGRTATCSRAWMRGWGLA